MFISDLLFSLQYLYLSFSVVVTFLLFMLFLFFEFLSITLLSAHGYLTYTALAGLSFDFENDLWILISDIHQNNYNRHISLCYFFDTILFEFLDSKCNFHSSRYRSSKSDMHVSPSQYNLYHLFVLDHILLRIIKFLSISMFSQFIFFFVHLKSPGFCTLSGVS